jgi:hypothetical protein
MYKEPTFKTISNMFGEREMPGDFRTFKITIKEYGIWRCILDGNKRSYDGLIQVSVAINLQLGLDDHYLSFIDPADFDTAKYQDKLIIHGPSGSGKSRIILELFKNKRQQLQNKQNIPLRI